MNDARSSQPLIDRGILSQMIFFFRKWICHSCDLSSGCVLQKNKYLQGSCVIYINWGRSEPPGISLLAMANPPGFAQFDFGERLGLVFIVEGASLSVLAITTLLAYITVGVYLFLGAQWLTPTFTSIALSQFVWVLRVDGQRTPIFIITSSIWWSLTLFKHLVSPPRFRNIIVSDSASGGMFNIRWIDAAVGLHLVSSQ